MSRSIPAAGRLTLLLATLLSAPLLPAPAAAQVWETAGGAVAGTAGGTLVTMAVLTGRARSGHFLWSPGDLRWEALPMVAGGVAGGLLGHQNPERLWRSMGWGTGGLALGAVAGGAAGRIFWGPSEGTWAGAVLGGAAGMVAGALVGALTWDGADPMPLQARMSLPVP